MSDIATKCLHFTSQSPTPSLLSKYLSVFSNPFQVHASSPTANTVRYTRSTTYFGITFIPRIPCKFGNEQKRVILVNISKTYDASKLNYFQLSDNLD